MSDSTRILPRKSVCRDQILADIWIAMQASLSLNQRVLLALYYCCELKPEEVAEIAGSSKRRMQVDLLLSHCEVRRHLRKRFPDMRSFRLTQELMSKAICFGVSVPKGLSERIQRAVFDQRGR